MVCPNCGKVMNWSDIVIDTYPETHEAFCDCGCAIDVCDGKNSLCWRSKLTDEQKLRVENILASGRNLSFIPTGEDAIG